MGMDDYKNDMKKIQAALDPVKKELAYYNEMTKSLTESATAAAKAISSITSAIAFSNPLYTNSLIKGPALSTYETYQSATATARAVNSLTSAIAYKNLEFDITGSMAKTTTAALKAYQSLKLATLNSTLQESITEAMSGLTEAIKTINNCTGNFENIIPSTNINKLMEETFSLKPMVEEFARLSSLSLNSGNSRALNFKDFNSDTVIDNIDNDDLSDSVTKPIKEFVSDNTNLINDIISFYGDDNHSSNKTNADTNKEIDWKFIIGSILIPLLIAYWGSKMNPPSTEINNNYNIEFKGDISHEDAEKIVETLEKFQHKNQQSDGINDQTEQ